MRPYCLIAFVLIAILLSACGPQPTQTEAPATPPGGKQPTPIPAPAKGMGLSVMVDQIMKYPAWYEGQYVTLVGYYRGPDLLDEVVLDAPVNPLTDWVIADDSGAMWVQYSSLLPFSPTSHEVWRIVRVGGYVEIHPNDRPYIVPTKVEWEGLKQEYGVLPALAKIAIHRFGGPEDLDHHIYWYNTRILSVVDAKTDWYAQTKLRQGKDFDLQTAFDKAQFFELPATVGTACKGCVRYYIAAVDPKENKPHFVTVYEGSVPEQLEQFIDLVIAETAGAKPIQ